MIIKSACLYGTSQMNSNINLLDVGLCIAKNIKQTESYALFFSFRLLHVCVVLNQISLVCKVYCKYQKQTLLQKYLDHHGCLERRHDFTKDPSRSQKHCFL